MTHNGILKKAALIFLSLFFIAAGASAGLIDADHLSGNMVKVTQKYPNCIIIKNHSLDLPTDHIIITPTSSIVSSKGTPVSIESLRLPCVAELRFHLGKSPDAELIELKVLEYADKTSAKFKSRTPFKRLPE